MRREAPATPPATKGHEAKWREESAAAGGSGLGKLGAQPHRLHPSGYASLRAREERACPVFGAATRGLFPRFLLTGNEFVGNGAAAELQRKVCSYPASLGSTGVRATSPTSANAHLTWPNEAMQQPRHRTKREGTQPGNVC